MPYRTVYNTGDTPVVVDPAGRTIGGREYGVAYDGHDEVNALVDDGVLVITPDVAPANAPATRPDALAVVERTQQAEARRQRFTDATRGDLHRRARARGLSSDQHTDGRLAALLALDPEAEVPAAAPAPTPSKPSDDKQPSRPAKATSRTRGTDEED